MLVAAIAERRIFGLLAIAQPYFFCFFGSKLQAYKMLLQFAVGVFCPASFVATIAEGLFFAEAAGTPGIGFTGFHLYSGGFAFGYFGQLSIIHVVFMFWLLRIQLIVEECLCLHVLPHKLIQIKLAVQAFGNGLF